MTEPNAISLKQFMQSRKPDCIHGLVFFRDDIITLYASGYSLKNILEYVKANGYKAGYSAMCKWISKNIDLEKEAIEFKKNGGICIEKRKTEENATTENNLKQKAETIKPTAHKEKLLNETFIKNDNPTSNTNAEKIAKMKASMEKLLGGETFDDQFAALNNEKNSDNKKPNQD